MHTPISGARRSVLRLVAVLVCPCAASCGPARPVDPPAPVVTASAQPGADAPARANDDHTERAKKDDLPRFTLVLPGGRIAKIPIAVVEAYVDPEATAAHGAGPAEDKPTMKHMDENADWHNDYEFGECFFDSGLGVTRAVTWHRHPFGSEYSELYE